MNKKIFNFIFNSLPFFAWIGCFFLELYNVEINPDLVVIYIILLLCLPILYSVYNLFFSADEKEFIIQNTIFGVAQVSGIYINGVLAYNQTYNDAETMIMTNFLSICSIVYILVLTFTFYAVKIPLKKNNKKSVISNNTLNE